MTELLSVRDKLLRYNGILPLIDASVKQNSILIIEPTDWHGEVIAPVVNYFIKLGFWVDVVVSNKNYTNDLLIDVITKPEKVRLFHLFLPSALSDELFRYNMRRYKHIFLTSTDDFTGVYYPRLFKTNYCDKFTKNNIFYIEHQWERFKKLTTPKERKQFIKNAFALHKFPYSKDTKVPYLSPTFYANVRVKPKNAKTRFLVAGRFDSKCRNMKLLLNILNVLKKSGISNFHLDIVGRVGNEPLSPEFGHFANNVTVWGDVTNSQLYTIAKNTDFVLALLSENNKEHVFDYTTNKTSGSFGLSLGFLKPVILNEVFAAAHGFTKDNAVLYSGDNLESAVIHAIDLKQRQYKKLCKNLRKKKKQQEKETLSNLQIFMGI